VFSSFCRGVKEGGIGDGAKNVFGDIEQVLRLNWSIDTGTRVIFHIADAQIYAPAVQEQSNLPDYSIRVMYKEMREKRLKYFFASTKDMTNPKIVDNSLYYGGTMDNFNVTNPARVGDSVTTAVSASITRTIEEPKTGSKRKTRRKYFINPTIPNWSAVAPESEGTHLTYELPKSIEDIVKGTPLTEKMSVTSASK
jgi:hypothetical protein